MTHQANTGMKAWLRLREISCDDQFVTDMALWSGMLHDVGRAGWKHLWAPHALYGAITAYYALGEHLWKRPGIENDPAAIHALQDNYGPTLYLIAYHHSGFKKTWRMFLQLLTQLTHYFITGEVQDNLILKWVDAKDCPPTCDFIKSLPHWDGPKAIIYGSLFDQVRRWAKHRKLALLPPMPFDRSTDFRAFLRHRAAMGALAFGDCVDTAEFAGEHRQRGGSLKMLSVKATEARDRLAKARGTATEGHKATNKAILNIRKEVFAACGTFVGSCTITEMARI